MYLHLVHYLEHRAAGTGTKVWQFEPRRPHYLCRIPISIPASERRITWKPLTLRAFEPRARNVDKAIGNLSTICSLIARDEVENTVPIFSQDRLLAALHGYRSLEVNMVMVYVPSYAVVYSQHIGIPSWGSLGLTRRDHNFNR